MLSSPEDDPTSIAGELSHTPEVHPIRICDCRSVAAQYTVPRFCCLASLCASSLSLLSLSSGEICHILSPRLLEAYTSRSLHEQRSQRRHEDACRRSRRWCMPAWRRTQRRGPPLRSCCRCASSRCISHVLQPVPLAADRFSRRCHSLHSTLHCCGGSQHPQSPAVELATAATRHPLTSSAHGT